MCEIPRYAFDIAQKLGTTAILSALVRTKCGEWGLADCVTLEELQEKAKITLVSSTSIVEGGYHDVTLRSTASIK